MIEIVSWNVNSVNVRLEQLKLLATNEAPDIILLQEIKCVDQKFPIEAMQELGYNCILFGQKSYNGVAILTKGLVEDVNKGFATSNPMIDEARYIECVTTIKGKVIRVGSLYLPNGQSVDSLKFEYKMNFFENLKSHIQARLAFGEVFLIGGDYNVAPNEIDVYDPVKLDGTIGFHYKERGHFNEIIRLGVYDTFRSIHPNKQDFSWWDYRAMGFKANKGMRIDHIVASRQALDIAKEAGVYKHYRRMERPSDHAPIYVRLEHLS